MLLKEDWSMRKSKKVECNEALEREAQNIRSSMVETLEMVVLSFKLL